MKDDLYIAWLDGLVVMDQAWHMKCMYDFISLDLHVI